MCVITVKDQAVVEFFAECDLLLENAKKKYCPSQNYDSRFFFNFHFLWKQNFFQGIYIWFCLLCSENRPFIVVSFPEENSALSIIPSSWIIKSEDKTFCWWPSTTSNVKKLVKRMREPNSDWLKVPVKVIHYCRKLFK